MWCASWTAGSCLQWYQGLIYFFFSFFCVVAPGFAGWEHTGSKILALEDWRNQWWTPHWLTQTAPQKSLPSHAFRGTFIHQSLDSSLVLLGGENDFWAFTMRNYIVIAKWLQIASMLCSVECTVFTVGDLVFTSFNIKAKNLNIKTNRACSWS